MRSLNCDSETSPIQTPLGPTSCILIREASRFKGQFKIEITCSVCIKVGVLIRQRGLHCSRLIASLHVCVQSLDAALAHCHYFCVLEEGCCEWISGVSTCLSFQ